MREQGKRIMLETSARHVHVCEADLETLFGRGARLHFVKELSQPGQFTCEERVDLIGPKGSFRNVIILGPTRPATQVEISLTDARALGVAAPVRESGDIAGTPGLKIVGPAGEVELERGVIAAKRHLHTTPEDAAALGVSDKEIVGVKVETEGRSLIFGDLVVRVSPSFRTYIHIDTDESNAAGCSGEAYGELCKL